MKRITWTSRAIERALELYPDHTYKEISKILEKEGLVKVNPTALRKAISRYNLGELKIEENDKALKKPKILLFDIETAPLIAYTWGLFDQNIGLNQVLEDTSVLSWAAKWYGEDEVMYMDVSKQKNLRDDKKIVKELWKLLDDCEIAIGQNSNSFDIKIMNSRFIQNGMQPPSSYKRLDTLRIAKKHFKFTSNKLAFMTDKLCTKHKKLDHAKYSGFALWKACLEGNKEAWKEMKDYNIADVTSLEELFNKLLPWESATIFNLYQGMEKPICSCGSTSFKKSGYYYTNTAKYDKFKCTKCGAESRGNENLISKEDRKKLRKSTTR